MSHRELHLGGHGLGDGAARLRPLLVRQRLAPQRRLHAIRNARRQLVWPQGNGGVTDTDGPRSGHRAAAKELYGFCLGHVPMLLHLPACRKPSYDLCGLFPSALTELAHQPVQMQTMKTLAERTQEALDAGFTVGQLARAAGKSSQAVSQWLAGRTSSLKADSAVGLEILTGWNSAWWATGKGERGEKRKGSSVGLALHAVVTSGKPSSIVEGLRGYLKEHTAIRRKVIGNLMAQLADDPDNEELADEVATQLEIAEPKA